METEKGKKKKRVWNLGKAKVLISNPSDFTIIYKGDMVSRNDSHFANGRLRPESRLYKDIITKEIKPLEDKEVFKIHVFTTIYFPKERFFTKKGLINKRSGDLDNYVKLPIDAIFKGLELDDSLITYHQIEKKVGDLGFIIQLIFH